jgi:hypothetical protein
MTQRKMWLSGLAFAIAIALSPLPELHAATFAGPGSQPRSDNVVQSAKMKKKATKKRAKKKAKKKSRRAASKGSSCGTYMYRSKGKCVDARNKK